ncbi:P-loop containing nucleoside triphosphate hydrolase protein [Hypoxylon trugodes]|uniref:P-loop containing nucleoside triphosphate hydrolase protein n=1 Tax=Hypoxylon trugodes TaxID=326681 RepID=UPI00219022AF|nr:P-loop containing nucleoside triphosphate hydrolase protein [Hypoxylon trugodes]KAI1390068.1 P-loop containing nucleoside triphosphate hydrolase protein [Hypoxylon trugodes]
MIADIGFSEVATGGERPSLDIVIIHGLGGHPRRTWRDRKTKEFWPRDRLAKSFSRARILVYGYDSKISKFVAGAANQNSFLDHAQNLLFDLTVVRKGDLTRPLLFICHSLGGIIAKDIHRRCEPGRGGLEKEQGESISKSTIGIIFMGTPHRGGSYGPLGKATERIVRYFGFDTNSSILHDLVGNGTSLQIIQEEFLMILERRSSTLPVYSFQEENGLAGVRGLNGKVVNDISSKLGYRYEIVAKLPGNHKRIARPDKAPGDWIAYNRLAHAVASCARGSERPVLQLPYGRDSNFIGRESELEEIRGFILTDKFFECAIVGLGGIGKTQVTIEFAHRLWGTEKSISGKQRHSIFWLCASDARSLKQDLTRLAHILGFADEDDYLSVIHGWFGGEQSGKWLLIVDSADYEDIFFKYQALSRNQGKRQRFCEFLPQKRGCGILYTSGNQRLIHNLMRRSSRQEFITINPMKTEESIEFVEKRLDKITLDGFPLALVQATEMIRVCHDTARDPKVYLELWNGTKQDQKNFDLPNAIFHSCALAIEQLRKQDEDKSGIHLRILSLISLLDRNSIPEWLLEHYLHVPQPQRAQSLGTLQSFSFTHLHQGTDSQGQEWRMHRLVKMAIHAYTGQCCMEKTLIDGLGLLVNAFFQGIYRIIDEAFRYQRNLEFTTHAQSMLYFLDSIGGSIHHENIDLKRIHIMKQTIEDLQADPKASSQATIPRKR